MLQVESDLVYQRKSNYETIMDKLTEAETEQ